MSLIVGTDSYVTLEEANTYISTYYTSTNSQRIAWESLSDEDKEVYLRNALVAMEQLHFQGRKYNNAQALAFPRNCDIEVPEAIKYAQVEEGLELGSPTEDTETAEEYAGNVESYSISSLSESYRLGSRYGLRAIIKSSKAQGLLRQFIGGGYSVK